MGQSPFRSIFIPSILAAGATFVAVTLPLSLSQSVPRWVALGSLQRQDIPVPEQSTKPVIRYIGFSIVASVAAGVATAELLRRWQKRSPNLLADQAFKSAISVTQQSSSLDAVIVPTDVEFTAEADPGTEAAFSELLFQTTSESIGEASDVFLNASTDDLSQPSVVQGTANPFTLLSEPEYNLEPVSATSDDLPVRQTGEKATFDGTLVERLLFPEQVLPLHVRIPLQTHAMAESSEATLTPSKTNALVSRERITFAIVHRGSYYCLLRTTQDSTMAEHWLQQLAAQEAISDVDSDTTFSRPRSLSGRSLERGSVLANYVVTQQADTWIIWRRHLAAVPIDDQPANNLAVMPQRAEAFPAWLAS
ncbi:MAG: hypothetical protein AAFU71_03635 [Cyanobacteria bacterium J06632_22]